MLAHTDTIHNAPSLTWAQPPPSKRSVELLSHDLNRPPSTPPLCALHVFPSTVVSAKRHGSAAARSPSQSSSPSQTAKSNSDCSSKEQRPIYLAFPLAGFCPTRCRRPLSHEAHYKALTKVTVEGLQHFERHGGPDLSDLK
jgi:hypothetical protein